MKTRLGSAVEEVPGQGDVKPPLQVTIVRFTLRIAWLMGIMMVVQALHWPLLPFHLLIHDY